VWARLTPGQLYIEVADDGVGGAVESDGLGLQGLRDRVEAIGGRLRVESPVGRGTRVMAAVPATIVGSRAAPS
jgi:signal transduction histidine kinase